MNKKVDPYKTDDENPEWTDEMSRKSRPATEMLSEIFGSEVADKMLKKAGRPPKDHKKIPTTIRLDAEILDAFKATGKGWQTLMNDALRDWKVKHLPAE